MPVDPQTGMWSNDVSYQPTGAMGAVANLLNAQKAQQIADTLQQSREAQASKETTQAQEYAQQAQRANQARQAVADLLQRNPHATPEEIANVSAPFEDPTEWTKLYRANQGYMGRLGAAQYGYQRGVDVANINQTGPLAQARAAMFGSLGNLADTRAQDIEATQQSRIDVNKAATADRYAQAALAQYRSSGKLTPEQGVQLWKIAAYYDDIERKADSDPVFSLINPEAQAIRARWGQNRAAVLDAARSSGVTPPPDLMTSPNNYTPFQGMTPPPSAGAATAPTAPPAAGPPQVAVPTNPGTDGKPVTRQITLPPPPGQ